MGASVLPSTLLVGCEVGARYRLTHGTDRYQVQDNQVLLLDMTLSCTTKKYRLWYFDYSSFEHTMSITARVYVDGIAAESGSRALESSSAVRRNHQHSGA